MDPEADIHRNGITLLPQNSEMEKIQTEKVSFYLRPDQLDKLEDLAREYRKHMGQRLNRNDLVRMMIDRCELEHLLQE